MLDHLQRSAFDSLANSTNPKTGLVADRSLENSHASIAVVGFALSAWPVGVERGWMSREEAVRRTLAALRFFWQSDQTGDRHATGFKGFYFHFLDMESGKRAWESELSIIDTAILVAGILTSAAYFTDNTPPETELRGLADDLYRRVDWGWAEAGGSSVVHGWRPNHGFMTYGWEGYSEALILYVLGLGSPTHPLKPQSFETWTMTYQWENLYGQDFLYAGPLFIHQLSHAWIDFRGLKDEFMREKGSDYFENSRKATIVQREYARRNPLNFIGYAEDRWGLSAGDGPTGQPSVYAGRRQALYSYAARGVPYGPDDGTVAGTAALSSLAFASDIALPVVRTLYDSDKLKLGRAVLAAGFNNSVVDADGASWFSDGTFGFDHGLVVLSLENFRSGLLWKLTRDIPYIRRGLTEAGFKGGWLSRRAP